VVTEYGIADLRGRTDQEIVAALLNVTDSRFQGELLARAKAAGKIRADYRVPEAFAQNTPTRLAGAFAPHRQVGFFSDYPFGTDLTSEEIVLAGVLKSLQARTGTFGGRVSTIAAALLRGSPQARHLPLLQRLKLDRVSRVSERLTQRLVTLALKDAGL
jgi:hypothetical protein